MVYKQIFFVKAMQMDPTAVQLIQVLERTVSSGKLSLVILNNFYRSDIITSFRNFFGALVDISSPSTGSKYIFICSDFDFVLAKVILRRVRIVVFYDGLRLQRASASSQDSCNISCVNLAIDLSSFFRILFTSQQGYIDST